MFGLKRRVRDKARIEELEYAITGYREIARATNAQVEAKKREIAELRARLAQAETELALLKHLQEANSGLGG